ncbi:hypothetical protein D3C80_1453130 [compost metagenome]
MPQAVRGVGQTMQQHHGAFRFAVRHHDVGAVPVGGKLFGIDRAVDKVAVQRGLLAAVQLVGHILADLFENGVLGGQIIRPTSLIDLIGVHFIWDKGMPKL